MVVLIPTGGGYVELAREDGGREILGAGLAVGAGDGDDRKVELLAPPDGQPLQC